MADAWALLVESGLPDGAARPAPAGPFDAEAVRNAVLATVRDGLAPPQVAPLLAYLRGWRRHWPARFREVFGPEGDRLIEDLEARLDDPNRYLKLRRIAVANLAGVL